MSIGELLPALARRLKPWSDSARLDAQVLLAQRLGRTRAWLAAHPEAELNPEQAAAVESAMQRLEQGEPLPYVLGEWEFLGLRFAVSPAVLIPRPETELLVEQALAWLNGRPPGSRSLAADVGAGSGCIAVSLAVQAATLQIQAIDISAAALEVARANAQRHGVAGRIRFRQADLLTGCAPAGLDLICANLPYIPAAELAELPVARFEPRLALDGGPDGLALIRRLLQQAQTVLAPAGLLLLEIEERQGAAALELTRQALPEAEVRLLLDLAGKERLIWAQAAG